MLDDTLLCLGSKQDSFAESEFAFASTADLSRHQVPTRIVHRHPKATTYSCRETYSPHPNSTRPCPLETPLPDMQGPGIVEEELLKRILDLRMGQVEMFPYKVWWLFNIGIRSWSQLGALTDQQWLQRSALIPQKSHLRPGDLWDTTLAGPGHMSSLDALRGEARWHFSRQQRAFRPLLLRRPPPPRTAMYLPY